MKIRIPGWTYAAAGLAIILTAALTEFAMGRKLWGVGGQPGIWSGNVWSPHNSQYMTDPYTFSHITHGVLLYALLRLIAPGLPAGMRLLAAIAGESLWEVIENTDLVIERYRAATISLNYYGDSVMNSMCDILACVVGYALAAQLPARVTLIGVIAMEVGLILWIRDSLFLNILMLIHPVGAIRKWQMGA
ncbi:MAG: DUF2585 family protein [Candidatus Binataceae bacterium]